MWFAWRARRTPIGLVSLENDFTLQVELDGTDAHSQRIYKSSSI
jgi:hypothetical protein